MRADRVFLVVLDSVGAGEAPDAARFGDDGAHTLRSCYESRQLHIPNLLRMGLGNIEGLSFLGKAEAPTAAYGRMVERSEGKDTTIGHWELAGHVSSKPLPTFPGGFPKELLEELSRRVGRGILCNRPASGTAVLAEYGAEHLRTGDLIVYTSADSVFQVAAHTDVVPLPELYAICETARSMLRGDLGVGRVIARPFAGSAPSFVRTADRRDYSLTPPSGLLPEKVCRAGLDSIAVGKIADIFAGVGFTRTLRTHSNREGMETMDRLVGESFRGLCFVNLVDFDMLWGHRRDPAAYARGLSELDAFLGDFLPRLGKQDRLILTADHGCDPGFGATTDHTRETVPLLIYGEPPEALGTLQGFTHVSDTVCRMLGL